MLSNQKNIIVFVLVLLFCSFRSLKAQNVEVVVKGIRSTKGQIVLAIFIDNESFSKEEPYIRKVFDKNEVLNGEMTVKFNLDPGIYGFSLLDDENSDRLMNYNFIGKPLEGFGFSNYYHSGFTRPHFDVFKFELREKQNQKIIMKIKYM
ncbi:MAG: DUF2141 domain-containing protein [Bacteroidales bacterium]|nr:DUF2141 domain-containing protein [Bacteroidales bacterium]